MPEPETAHNRRVIYCSLCLHYSALLMLPGCLHTALLPWRQPATPCRADKWCSGPGPLTVSGGPRRPAPGVERPARCSPPSDIRRWFELASEPPGRAEAGSVSLPPPPQSPQGWSRMALGAVKGLKVKPQSGHRLDKEPCTQPASPAWARLWR